MIMNAPVYYEKSVFGETIYEAEGPYLAIRSTCWGWRSEKMISLAAIHGMDRRDKAVFPRRIVLGLSAVLISGQLAFHFCRQAVVLQENLGGVIADVLLVLSVGICLAGIWFVVSGAMPVDRCVLQGGKHESLHVIVRTRKNREAFDIFLSDLKERIAQAFVENSGPAVLAAPASSPGTGGFRGLEGVKKAATIYYEDSIFGRNIYEIDGLCLTRRDGFTKSEKVFAFGDLKPACKNGRHVFPLYSVIFLVMSALLGMIVWGLWRQTFFPNDVALYPGILCAGALYQGVMGLVPRQSCIFFRKQGRIAFIMLRKRSNGAAFDLFLAELQKRLARYHGQGSR